MLFVSDKAKIKIDEIMNSEGMTTEHFVRISVTSGGCSGLSYQLDFDDKLKDEDQEFSDKGIKLVTDLRSFLYVANTTLDFSDGLAGKGFHFNNPNANRSCSCGESFSV